MLFVGDDWAEDHHDVEVVDESGRLLVRRRLPEGLEGVTRLHALIAEHMPDDWLDLDPGEAADRVKVGIETDRGSWVAALVAAGYEVFPINPLSVGPLPRAAFDLGGEVRCRRRASVGGDRPARSSPPPAGGRGHRRR
jgi:Transposase